MFPATEWVRARYVPYRAEHGKHLPFESADFRPVVSPFDRKPITNVGFMNEAQAFENLDTLARTFRENKIPKTHERIAILKNCAERMKSVRDRFADLIAWEGGKPLKDARVEVDRAIGTVTWAAEEAGRIAGKEIPMRATPAASGHIAFTYPEPIGVALAISAFNHPLNLIAHQVAPALAVGCPVMVKPASATPLSCLHFVELLYEAGLPSEMCLPLIADGAVAEKIAQSPEIAFLSFIGSADVGWRLRSILAPGARFALEHGGTAPVVIDESADLNKAVPMLLRGAYYHSGQVCVSVQRIFVHDKVYNAFKDAFVEGVKKLKVGNPREESTDCGPIIRERDLVKIEDRVSTAVKNGARLLTGGRRANETCYEPTVLEEPHADDPVMTEEIFGPVACIRRFTDADKLIAEINAVKWKFQAAVYTENLDRAMRFGKGIRASAVMVNDSTTFRVDWMPFRGDGPSGFGTGGIPYSMHDLVTEKLVVVKSPAFEL